MKYYVNQLNENIIMVNLNGNKVYNLSLPTNNVSLKRRDDTQMTQLYCGG